MTVEVIAPARLLALRLQGFKSFAERTVVEFGGGISAVVGPNGSGKSNLADALRWALGEQGRALRSRKSEDVIFAGSEKRAALGMADVTLVLDNGDGLLPVEFAVLELGRRLFRSGENDYLMNKQRVRLRDLVDLLDAANLADNAFLFIGQGMVDQALSLRPEERRPLFEEVAGVRRHERRRRKAEEQLAESEANLARVEDILAELRPQARRLAVQAEQQATRTTAGEELANALVVTAHVRWHEAAARATEAASRVTVARTEADAAMADLQSAEEGTAAIAAELDERAEVERERREAHEAARSVTTGLRLREARLSGDLDGVARDRSRATDERAAAEAELAARRRSLAAPMPPRDHDLEAALAEAERDLAEALAELGGLRAERLARGDEAAALRRAESARATEAETARRRLTEAERRLAEQGEASTQAEARREELDRGRGTAASDVERAMAAERAAIDARETARLAAEAAEAMARAAVEDGVSGAAALASARGRLEALEAVAAQEEARGIARAARRHGGRRVDEDLAVDPTFRAAVEAALHEAARAYVVDREAVSELAEERGMVVVGDGAANERGATTVLEAARAGGGGPLVDAIRRDPTGAVGRLLARAVWLPNLDAALDLQPTLPPGWLAVVRDGSAVVTDLSVRLGRADATLERRDELDRVRAEAGRLAAGAETAAARVDDATAAAERARAALDEARAAEGRATAERRAAEERLRAAERELETAAREAGWQLAQRDRLGVEVDRLRGAVPADDAPSAASGAEPAGTRGEDGALAAWESRASELRIRRDRLAADVAAADANRRAVESKRAVDQAAGALAEERIARAERESAKLVDREVELAAERDSLAADIKVADRREATAADALGELRAADADDRGKLATAERAASAARDRLRLADDRLRTADRADLEARLGRDSLREQLVVELAGMGEPGLRRLRAVSPSGPDAAPPGDLDTAEAADLDDAVALEAALDAAVAVWAATSPTAEPASPGRLAYLRRRYHELGAANPFAVEEYEELRARLESLETQGGDLRRAIESTRELIGQLNAMIADQFQATFRALEVAFDARFRQLFGGGFARLSLTDPADLASTGVEIVARPPGKKPQALAMLSGGERALTAVALLFAMLEVRPVPFCVLDEVDAALDEANVGRFTEALRGLAERTQFIVITHNRGTIEVADALYGVTVGDDSVSRVISLRLDEARAIADRRDEDVAVGVG
jgi:chromosome segregation protein